MLNFIYFENFNGPGESPKYNKTEIYIIYLDKLLKDYLLLKNIVYLFNYSVNIIS